MSYFEIFFVVLGLVVAAFVVEYLLERRRDSENRKRFRARDRRQHKLADSLGPPKAQPLTRRLPRTGDSAIESAEELRDRSAA